MRIRSSGAFIKRHRVGKSGAAERLVDAGEVDDVQELEDRNKTSHLYNEAMAEDVYQRLAAYAELMSKATGRLPGAGGG